MNTLTIGSKVIDLDIFDLDESIKARILELVRQLNEVCEPPIEFSSQFFELTQIFTRAPEGSDLETVTATILTAYAVIRQE